MARGYPGAFGRTLNAPYVWIPLCLLFLAPFVDLRRPFRLLHLDLLVLVAFGASHVFFNRGEIGVSVPLVYPVLLYLLVRMLFAGFRPRERSGRLVPHVPAGMLAIGLVLLVAFRIGLNVVDSNVIDVGYAGVIGADRIADGDQLYGEGFSEDVEKGDTYGPANYLFYVPFEQALRWSGTWDDLPAAHGAALAFDLLVIGGLLLLGRALRTGREGRLLGVALAYAWAAYPYTAFTLQTNANDTLVALACVAALLAFAWRSAAGAGVAVGLGAASKFAPLALAPLFARRSPLVFAAALALTLALCVLPFVPDGGLREMYDRTVGYQAGRGSPFSIWGQADGLGGLQTGVKVAAVALALLVAFVPRRPDERQLAALGAAVLIALQLAVTHWFYLYVVWFVPFVLVAMLAAYRPSGLRLRGRQQQLPDGLRAPLLVALHHYGVEPGILGGGLEAHLRERQEALDRLLALHPDHAAARTGHAHVGHVGGPARQHAGVGGGHVGVGAHARQRAPVEMPAHRHLLAGGLGVHVHEHGVAAVAQVRQQRVGLGEGRAHGAEEHLTREVDHAEAPPVRLDHRVAAARAALRVVGRAHDARLLVEVLVDLAVAVGVVAERDRVGAELEQLARGLAGDAHAARGVLAVDHHEVRLVLLADAGKQRGQRPAADAAHHVADEKELHDGRFCQPARGGDDGDPRARRARPGQALRRARGPARRVARGGPRRAGGRDRPQRGGQDHPAVDPGRHPARRRGQRRGAARDGLGAPAAGAVLQAHGGGEPDAVRAARGLRRPARQRRPDARADRPG